MIKNVRTVFFNNYVAIHVVNKQFGLKNNNKSPKRSEQYFISYFYLFFISIHPGYGQSVNICFGHEKKKLLFCIQQKLTSSVQYNKMATKAKVRLKLLDVFEDFNNFVDMNGSIYR